MAASMMTLTAVEKSINNITCYETIDIDVLNKLINSSLLKKYVSGDSIYLSERDKLIAYKKLVSAGKATVSYRHTDGMTFGRCNPDFGLSLFNIRKQVRYTLANGKYADIDIENCHPSILKQICDINNIECDNLTYYVEHREECLKDVMTKYGVSRNDAKDLYIILMYFGGFDSWASDHNVFDKETKDIKNFKDELTKIGEIIASKNRDILLQVRKRKKSLKINDYNEVGSTVSIYLQEIESRILNTIYLYCVAKKYIIDNNCVLCADGLMIPIEQYSDKILDEFTDVIENKFGFNLKFVNKEIPVGYMNDLDSNQITPEQIIIDEIPSYKFDKIEQHEFNIAEMTRLFLSDIETLGGYTYIKYLEHTNSFKYFNKFHAEFYEMNKINKIYNNQIHEYKEFRDSFKQLHFITDGRKNYFVDLYRESIHKNTYSTFQFEPSRDIVKLGDKYNLFRGFKYESCKTFDINVVDKFISHIKYICNELDTETTPITDYLINWFAHIVQKPYIKTKVAIVLYSEVEGVGKNLISDIMEKIFDGYCAKIQKTDDISSNFNGEMMGRLFVVGNEIKARASDISNELKELITQDIETIHMKCKERIFVNDFKNYFFTTNNENVFKISKSDRRFMFIECCDIKNSLEYYQSLINFKNDDNCISQLHAYLSTKDITNYNPTTIVETEYKNRLKMDNIPAYLKYIKDEFKFIENMEWRVSDLYKKTIEYAQKHRYTSTYSERTVIMCYSRVFGEFKQLNKSNQSVYMFTDYEKTIKCIADNYINN